MNNLNSIAEKAFYDPAIDGLRGIAILSVILNHAMYCATQDHTRNFQWPFLIQVGEGGAGGVSLFFVLSALTLMMSTRFRFSYEQFPKAAFYIRRAFRILPLWWIFILISTILRKPSDNEIMPHLFMYFGFLPHMNFTHIGWSLFVEETFYFFFPLIFMRLMSLTGALLFFLIAILFSGRLFLLGLEDALPPAMQFLTHIPIFHYVTFALGVFAFHLVKLKPDRMNAMISLIPKLFWDIIAAGSFVFYLLCQAHSNLQILACFILVISSMVDGTVTRKILSIKMLRAFGICCYSIYLFHGLFLFSIRYTEWFHSLGREPLNPDFQMLFAFALTSIASYFFGIFSFKYFEQPCVRLGKRTVQKLDLGRL